MSSFTRIYTPKQRCDQNIVNESEAEDYEGMGEEFVDGDFGGDGFDDAEFGGAVYVLKAPGEPPSFNIPAFGVTEYMGRHLLCLYYEAIWGTMAPKNSLTEVLIYFSVFSHEACDVETYGTYLEAFEKNGEDIIFANNLFSLEDAESKNPEKMSGQDIVSLTQELANWYSCNTFPPFLFSI